MEIVGVSADSAASHRAFKEKYDLPFTLLADTEKAMCRAYDVWGEKRSGERIYEGIHRTTYLIDPAGKIIRVFENVKPVGHSLEVLEALA